jgi:hypothetical protein
LDFSLEADEDENEWGDEHDHDEQEECDDVDQLDGSHDRISIEQVRKATARSG